MVEIKAPPAVVGTVPLAYIYVEAAVMAVRMTSSPIKKHSAVMSPEALPSAAFSSTSTLDSTATSDSGHDTLDSVIAASATGATDVIGVVERQQLWMQRLSLE